MAVAQTGFQSFMQPGDKRERKQFLKALLGFQKAVDESL